MSEYVIVKKADLIAVADTIRAKSGSTEEMSLPDGFISAMAVLRRSNGETGEYQTVTVNASEVKATFVNKFYGYSEPTNILCRIDGSNDYHYRTLLQHDFSKIPSDAEILSATLKLYIMYGNDNYTASQCYVGRVLGEWAEDTSLTWANQPEHQSYSAASPETPAVSPGPVLSWVSVDITPIVRQWCYGTATNYGVVVRAINEGNYRYNWDVCNRRTSNELATRVEVTYRIPV